MFKRIDVGRRNLVGNDGGSGCKVEGVYKKKKVLRERGGQKISQKRKVTI